MIYIPIELGTPKTDILVAIIQSAKPNSHRRVEHSLLELVILFLLMKVITFYFFRRLDFLSDPPPELVVEDT